MYKDDDEVGLLTYFPINWNVLVIFSFGSSPEANALAAAGPIPGT